MPNEFTRKLFINKKTKQLSITLPKKQLLHLFEKKKKYPKEIKLKIQEIKW